MKPRQNVALLHQHQFHVLFQCTIWNRRLRSKVQFRWALVQDRSWSMLGDHQLCLQEQLRPEWERKGQVVTLHWNMLKSCRINTWRSSYLNNRKLTDFQSFSISSYKCNKKLTDLGASGSCVFPKQSLLVFATMFIITTSCIKNICHGKVHIWYEISVLCKLKARLISSHTIDERKSWEEKCDISEMGLRGTLAGIVDWPWEIIWKMVMKWYLVWLVWVFIVPYSWFMFEVILFQVNLWW